VIVLFGDEVTFYRQPSQAWLWSWLGRRQPRLPYSHRANTQMRIVGVLDAITAQVRVWDFPRVTAPRLARCWRELGTLYPAARKIYLVLDNWPVHYHPVVQDALAADPRIEMLPLPTYAPWLNHIEKLWRWVKQRVSHAHPWSDDFVSFKRYILEEFERLAPGSPEVRRYCGLEQIFSL
jgi:hypothetical protein